MVCPHCGADQLESSLAVSTFCRNCGEHFKLTPVQQKSRFSFAGLFKGKSNDEPSLLEPAVQRPSGIAEPTFRARQSVDHGFDGDDEEDAISTRDTSGFSGEPTQGDGQSDDFIEVEAPNALANNGGNGAKPFKEKEHSATDRRVPCVDCGQELFVSTHAKSTICSQCSAYVSLQSHDISRPIRENIKTRGDIRIRKSASITATQVVCTNLKVYGEIAGKIDCAGEAFFKTSGKVVGNMKCKHLIIHKSCDLTFMPGIHAETAEIYGKVHGDIICDGKIKITKTAAVIGDCTAPTVVLEDGGSLAGQMRFMAPDSEMMAEYARRAEEAQEDLFEEDESFEPSGDTVVEDAAHFDFDEELEDEEEAA